MAEVGFAKITHKYLAGLAPKTRASYAHYVRSWAKWCQENSLDPLDVERVHIELWGRWLVDVEGKAATTQKSYMSIVRNMYTLAFADQEIERNPAANIRLPRIKSGSQGTWVDKDVLAQMLELSKAHTVPTVGALVHMLGLHGWRLGSVLAADIEDMQTDGESMTLAMPIKGYEGKTRFSVAPLAAIQIKRCTEGRKSGKILLDLHGNPLSSNTARKIVADMAARAGAKEVVTPHSLRRSFVTLCRDAGIPDRDIMASTSHKHREMLDYYDRKRDSLERNAGEQLSAWLSA